MEGEKIYPHKDLTEKIIKAAFKVHNKLGSGFVEKVSENAMAEELKNFGYLVEQQKDISVIYKDKPVGEFIADLIVEKKVLVELKAVKSLTREFEAKLIHYLKSTSIEVGLLINFGNCVQIRRKIYTSKSVL